MNDLSTYTSFLTIKEKKIFDPIRKKWLVITPEELVRQCVLYDLIYIKKVSSTKILSEYNYTWNQKHHRCDVVILDPDYAPLIIIEVKAAHIPLGEKVFQQASRYLYVSSALGLIITNGIESIHLYKIENTWHVVDDLFQKLKLQISSH